MKYSDWDPIYREILVDFGFEQEKDEEAASVASETVTCKREGIEKIKQEVEGRIRGKIALICGNAPCLERDIIERGFEDILDRKYVVIAADGATSVLLHNAIIPNLVVSDLDGNITDIIYANRLGAIIVVHAHGDNIDMLKKVLPVLNGDVICTTQSKPVNNVFNFGGFTDGDRCVFLAKEFGAEKIELIGFDYEDEEVTARKKKKLKWAKRLIGEVLILYGIAK